MRDVLLFLHEAGFENDAAAVDFAIYLFWIFGEADGFHFGASFDDHRRASYFEVFDYGYCIAIK